MTDTGTETRIVSVAGRAIVVRKLKDAQLVLMSRDATLLGKEGVLAGRKLEAAGRIMDMFESLIVQEADKDYVMEQVVQGKLELDDFKGFVSAFQEPESEEVKPVVRRGRPPRKG